MHQIYFVKNLYNQIYVWCCKYAKKSSVQDVPINNYELLNTRADSFVMFWNRGCTQSVVVSCKYWVAPLIPKVQAIVRSSSWMVDALTRVTTMKGANGLDLELLQKVNEDIM